MPRRKAIEVDGATTEEIIDYAAEVRQQLAAAEEILGFGMAHHHLAQAEAAAQLVSDPATRQALDQAIATFARKQAVAEGQTGAVGAALLVPVASIDDNPFQTRTAYDAEEIAALAANIAQHGLLQIPLARPVGNRYQVAFGHRRLRAYQHLSSTDPRFHSMPLQIRDIDDETMALHCWSENKQRKDITPYEEARAIERYTSEFGWTQARAADRLGLDRSTVANKLRLLKLPAAALDQLRSGTLSERQAAALLPLVDLPVDILDQQVVNIPVGNAWVRTPLELITHASELDSTVLRRTIELVRERLLRPLAKVPWRTTEFLDREVKAARCADCPLRIKSSDGCPNRPCYDRKGILWQAQQAEAAADSLGLPVTTCTNYGEYDTLGGVDLTAIRAKADEKKCGQLAVFYNPDLHYIPHPVEGFPKCAVVCGHGKSKKCACRMALARSTDPGVSQQAKERHDRQLIRATYLQPAESMLASALSDPATLPLILHQLLARHTSKPTSAADLPSLAAEVAKALAYDATKYSLEYGASVPGARQSLERLLAQFQIRAPWMSEDVCAQTPAAPGTEAERERLDRELRALEALGPEDIEDPGGASLVVFALETDYERIDPDLATKLAPRFAELRARLFETDDDIDDE